MGQQNQNLTFANDDLGSELATLEGIRDDLIKDMEALNLDYDSLVEKHDSLITIYEKEHQQILAQQQLVNKIKKSATNDEATFQRQIQQLQDAKKDMLAMLDQLKSENQNLHRQNQELGQKLLVSEKENETLKLEIASMKQMTTTLESDRSDLMAKSTRANNFLINFKKQGNKSTGSARRTRTIQVSFDIFNLPEAKKGEHQLYIVLKDAKGIPVKVANPVEATIKSSTTAQGEPIIAQQMMTASLFEKGRLQFKVEPLPGTLHKGYYRALVYADWGLIGGAQFQLR